MDTQDFVGIEAHVSTDKEMGEVGCGRLLYSKTCLKRPLKKKTKNCFSRPIIA